MTITLPTAAEISAAHAALFTGRDPETTIPDLQAVIEHAILNDPRTLQTVIGPSSLGTPCDACLISELGGLPAQEDAAWLPTIGRAVHEWIEGVLIRHLFTSLDDRYLPEGRVKVGTVGGVDIHGNTDVLDVHTGTVVDFKLVGTTTLRKVRPNRNDPDRAAPLGYQRQAQLYGKGWEDAGYQVRSVAIWFLPRNGFRISDGHIWQAPYDRAVAEATLAHADMLAGAIAAFGVDTVLSGTAHTGDEFGCAKYDPSIKTGSADALKQLDGLLAPTTPDAHGAGSTAA